MEDLRLLAVEQDFVLLESSSGETFRVALDEALRRAVRQDRSVLAIDAAISPREVQDLVRAGHSTEDVVSRTGAPLAYVEKFAAPVIDEITHIVKSALAVRLSFLNDRFGETNQIEFGALIREKLDALGAAKLVWSARKIEGGSWQIRCEFDLNEVSTIALWSFDLRKSSLSPENEVALNLALAQDTVSTLLPKAKSPLPFADTPAPRVEQTVFEPTADRLVAKNLTSSLGETQEFAEVIPFGRGRGNTQQVPVIAAGTSAEVDQEPDSFDDFEDDNGDLLESLRRRRDSRQTQTGLIATLNVAESSGSSDEDNLPMDLDFDESTVWIDSSDEIFVETAASDNDVSSNDDASLGDSQSDLDTQANTIAKRGRAAMPSWDEIVFGTKPDTKDDSE